MATCTLLGAASCSQDLEKADVASTSQSQAIGFMTNTSRADILTISNLQDDKAGFSVFGIKASSDTWDSEMDGSNNYSYATGEWAWLSSTPEWPTDTDDYPINFYAYYMVDDSGVTIVKDDEATLSITYAAPTTGQTDILAASATADARPTGDRLPLTFNHILSKINFTVTPGDGYTVYSQAVGLNNILSERTYLLASGWDDQTSDDSANYSYMNTQYDAIASPAALVASYGDLMLLPQVSTSWTPVEGSTTIEGGHIYILYRATDSTNSDVIGYTDASDHPNYSEETDSKYDDTPLFVKVGYPLGTDTFEFESGMGYTYNIKLCTDGATNGYLLSDKYYDEEGKETDFDIIGKDVSDPVSDGYINFTVTVNAWSDSTVDFE